MYDKSGAEADRLDMHQIFEECFQKAYQKDFDKNKEQHFSDATEMGEYFDDGLAIIEYFKKHRNEYFTTRKCRLLGIELPLLQKLQNNLYLKAYLDVVLYDEDLDKVYIIDFKTSRSSWNESQKKDELKSNQLLLYKKYFSEQYNFDINKIEIKFVILKRKIWEQSEYPQSRIQIHIPASGKIKMKKCIDSFQEFLNHCFNNDGTYKLDNIFTKNTSNCKYCIYLGKECNGKEK
jgi:hypothetical protein